MKLDVGDLADLQPIIAAAVRATLDEIEATERKLGDRRLSYTQHEAAALLGLKPTALRDLRLKGELRGKMAGKKMMYSRKELLRFLEKPDR